MKTAETSTDQPGALVVVGTAHLVGIHTGGRIGGRYWHAWRLGNAGADVKELVCDDRDDLARAIGLVQELVGQFAAAAQNQVDAAGTVAQRKAQCLGLKPSARAQLKM